MDFQSELKKMEDRLEDLEVKIDSIDSKLSRVMDALVGNPILRSDGIVGRIEKQDKEVQELKDFKKKILYGVGAIVMSGLLIDFLIRLYLTIK
jgi:uncharacterized protein Yka (UPF0111/DUF47 family)